MAPRTRTAAFSLAALFVLAGVACAVLVNGVVGEVLTIVLICMGPETRGRHFKAVD